MASRNNPYARDPALAKAFDNIAGMFAPPSGADAAGWANAAAKKAEAQRMAELYSYAQDPAFDRGAFERRAVAGGLYTPDKSYYSVDQGNLTTRRGQDVSANTSVGNNIRDNSTKAFATRYGALNEGQILPAMPGSVASMYGLPEQGVVAGAFKLGQGQDAVLPEGQRVEGPAKPLSESEMRAAIIGRQPDQVQTDFALGGQAPVVALGPDGKTPVYASPGAAARMQMPAAAAPSGTPVRRSEGVALIAGKQVPVTRAPDGLEWQLPDGTPLPPDARVMDLPKATGSNAELGLPTTANTTASNNRAAEITGALGALDLYENLINKNPGSIGLAGMIRGTAQNLGATMQDLTAAFGAKAPQLAEAAQSLQSGMKGVAPDFFDPAIPEADFLQGTLAYALARTENPSGEVSRQAFDRALDRVRGGGLLANTAAARAAIGANRKVLQTQLQSVQTLRGQQPARTDPGYQEPAAPPAAMPQPSTRLRFDANGNPI
jgi:hypothetical protein